MAERPTGVTIISLLGFLGGIISVLAGIAFLIAGGIAGAFGGFAGILGVLGAAAGLVFFILGIIQLVVAYGLWKMKKWGLYIQMLLLIIGILMNIVTAMGNPAFGIVGIVISAVILYYLYTKRDLFG